MKKIIILSIIFFTMLITGCANKESESAVSAKTSSADKIFSSLSAFSPMSDSKDGVEVTINDVKKENGETVIEIAMNNHSYNLEGMDAKNRSSLSGSKPNKYIIKSSAMGGHHVQAEMIFNKELSGPLVIALNDNLVFNFNIK